MNYSHIMRYLRSIVVNIIITLRGVVLSDIGSNGALVTVSLAPNVHVALVTALEFVSLYVLATDPNAGLSQGCRVAS